MKNKSSDNINVKPLSDLEFQTKYQDRIRHGKTAREHKSGVWRNRLENRLRRAQEK